MDERNKGIIGKPEAGDVFQCSLCLRAIPSFYSKCPFCSSSAAPSQVPIKTDIFQDFPTEKSSLERGKASDSPPAAERTYMKFFLFESESDNPDDRESEKMYFPPPCVDSKVWAMRQQLRSGLESLSSSAPPRAIVSADQGQTCYLLVAGTKLSLGRQIDAEHISTILFPESDYSQLNSNVSRTHCRLFIKKKKVYLKEMSRNGTYHNGQTIHFNRQVSLAHADRIWLSDVLELQVQVYTDGKEIISVLLKRLNNMRGERYVLAPGYIPFGKNVLFPVNLVSGPQCGGAFYYNTEFHSWHVRFPERAGTPASERTLDSVSEISFGSTSLWFSPLG